MADKTFVIGDLLADINVELNIAPFLGKEKFTSSQIAEMEDVASMRIHDERRIQRIKNFHILDC